MRRVLVLVGFAWGLMAPATALGVVILPPGKAGANQYSEVIPTSHGNTAPPGSGGRGGSSSAANLGGLGHGRAGLAGVSRLGGQGQAVAALAGATAPQPALSGGSVRGVRISPANAASGAAGSSAAGAIASALSGSGGLGVVLPIFLVGAVVGAILLVAARSRSRDQPKHGV
jgi:hypothetical protein